MVGKTLKAKTAKLKIYNILNGTMYGNSVGIFIFLFTIHSYNHSCNNITFAEAHLLIFAAAGSVVGGEPSLGC
jgi:hypothetical protein